jgi:hypothetical protein
MECTEDLVELTDLGEPTGRALTISCCLPPCAENNQCIAMDEVCIPPYNGSTEKYCRDAHQDNCDPANGDADCPPTQICYAEPGCFMGGCCIPNNL